MFCLFILSKQRLKAPFRVIDVVRNICIINRAKVWLKLETISNEPLKLGNLF